MRVLSGRYGPYVKHEATNANVPKGADPGALTLEQALALLATREGAPGKSKRVARKPAAKKAPAKKAAARAKKAQDSVEAGASASALRLAGEGVAGRLPQGEKWLVERLSPPWRGPGFEPPRPPQLPDQARAGSRSAWPLPPVGVADVVERDADGDLFVRLAKAGEDAPLIRLAPGSGEVAAGAPGLGDRLLVRFETSEGGEREARLIKRLGQSAHRVLGVVRKAAARFASSRWTGGPATAWCWRRRAICVTATWCWPR